MALADWIKRTVQEEKKRPRSEKRSLEGLAKSLGVTPSFAWRWTRPEPEDRARIPMQHLEGICAYFGVGLAVMVRAMDDEERARFVRDRVPEPVLAEILASHVGEKWRSRSRAASARLRIWLEHVDPKDARI